MNQRSTTNLISTSIHHTNYSFIYKNSANNISWHHNPHISWRKLWIFLISPAAPFIILLSQSLFLEHEPYLPSANPRLPTAGGAEGKQEGTREMSCLPVQLGNLPNHQPVIYLADGTQSRSDIHYFHQPNTLLGCSRNISLSPHTWLQKWRLIWGQWILRASVNTREVVLIWSVLCLFVMK